jgi:hypothetical protein
VPSASFAEVEGGIAVALPEGEAAAESLAPGRQFRDRRGHLWTLREKRLRHEWTARHLAPSTLARAAQGWLVFECGMMRVVVNPPPDDWRELDDRGLLHLMKHHASQRRRPLGSDPKGV